MIKRGEWHTYRHDDQLTAHCDLPGNIIAPRIAWKTYIGGTRQIIVPLPTRVDFDIPDILLCYGGVIIRSDIFGKHKWQSKPFGIHGITTVVDIDGDGCDEIIACNGLEVFIFSADDGRLLWSKRFAPPKSYGIYASTLKVHKFFKDRNSFQLLVPAFHTKDVFMFDFSNGAAKGELLHTLSMEDAFHPTTVIGDVDNDGFDEILVSRLGDLAVFDSHSGKMKSYMMWNTDAERRRTYGLIELTDIDNDGDLECIILAKQVTRHIAVLDNDGKGNFRLLWDRFIEHIYPTDTTELHYVNNSICDIDNDGKKEIIACIFNEHKDERWRTEIINAVTGETKTTIMDRYLYDVRDIDNDGMPELFLSCESERLKQPLSDIQIMRPDETQTILWKKQTSAFVTRTKTQIPTHSKFRPEIIENDEVLNEDGHFFVYDTDGAIVKTSFEGFQEKKIFKEGKNSPKTFVSLIVPPYYILSNIDGNIQTIEEIDGKSNPRAQWQCGASLATEGHPVERPSPTPVIFSTDKGERYLAVPDYSNSVSLYKFLSTDRPPERMWKKPGRGKIGFDVSQHSISVADMNNDGVLGIFVAEEDIHSVLSMYDVHGERMKKFEFVNFPSINKGPRIGCYDWLFIDNKNSSQNGEEAQPMLFTSFYASLSMNSESSECIDMSNGMQLWRRQTIGEGESGRGFGAWGLASINKANEIYFCAKDLLCRIDARSGYLKSEPVLLTDLTRDEMVRRGMYDKRNPPMPVTVGDPFTAYGSVILRDVNCDGQDELFVMGSFGGFGVLDADMNVLWWHIAPMSDVLYRLGGIAEVNGGGNYSVGVGHSSGEFVCYNAITGEEEWRIDLGKTTIDCATCDIDGDGREEFICRTTNGRLLSIGLDVHEKPQIKWVLQFDYSVGNPVIADFNGDGVPEIFIVAGDGWLYCVQ